VFVGVHARDAKIAAERFYVQVLCRCNWSLLRREWVGVVVLAGLVKGLRLPSSDAPVPHSGPSTPA
jgi:hypothetical protein